MTGAASPPDGPVAGDEPARAPSPEPQPPKPEPPKPVDWFPFGLAAFFLTLGLLILWLIPLAEESDVEVSSRFAVFDLVYAFLGRWGLFGLFAGPAALLLLGGLFNLGDDRPWLKFIVDGVLTLILLVGLPLGGMLGASWAFGEGRWVWGSVFALVAAFGGLLVVLELIHRTRRLLGSS
jgi:hypothetical protein